MKDYITSIFGTDVFSDDVMRQYLTEDTFKTLCEIRGKGGELSIEIADEIAHAMKDWAIQKGATHYTHWFQPMTGITAEKHDSFLALDSEGKIIMDFSGKELIKGEPDASSFPSGGLRNTFEARGYTTWDCTSPAFVKEDAAGVTLCIPTAFCSYTGEALDKKTPLLRSMEAIDKQAVRVLHAIGRTDVNSVSCLVGPEQEYFLVDKKLFWQREDLIFTGRTLFGAKPPKGQEMDDHYFGSLKERIASFMKELNNDLWKLGITAKTQHNEAAPAQHELAVIYDTCNIACDHNQLVMETMKKVAKHHDLECLLHEKPFQGVNGSGKHNNWSMVTDKGENLFKPGKTPHDNLQFLLFLSAVMNAVDEYPELLIYSASNPGNDCRLGKAEAPPSIVSIFLGEQLDDIVDQYIKTGEATASKKSERLKTGVHSLPELKKDATDRNRTSPFAFTGNKFEFRSVASSLSIGGPNTVINTIVADVLSRYADELEACKDEDKTSLIKSIIRKSFSEHRRILFDGNGYGEDWVLEAKKRGLPNLPSMVNSTKELISEKNVAVFERQKVFSKTELESRQLVSYEIYAKSINIEARTMLNMASKLLIPAAIKFNGELAKSIYEVERVLGPSLDDGNSPVALQRELLKKSTALLEKAMKAHYDLNEEDKIAKKMTGEAKAFYFREKVVPLMDELRAPLDKLERIVDKNMWPIPTYSDLLYDI
ncbi:MAG: glutamine synthetase III [Lachnospiraceae bacterium]|nr:glutamine synthetase III [Lachnospiraceae bacterium]